MNEKRKPHLLAMTDDPGDAGMLRQAVRQSGLDVELCIVDDPAAALQFLRREGERFRQSHRPDLILLDTRAPGQDALEMLAMLKQDEQLRAIPVVVMSPAECENDVRTAYSLGAAGYLPRPTAIDDLAVTINKLGQYWFRQTRLPENCTAHTDKNGSLCGHNE